MKKLLFSISLIFIMIFLSAPTYADTISFDLNLNNESISGGPWGKITLTEVSDYQVDFTVDPFATAFTSTTAGRFGVQSFVFNENTDDAKKLQITFLSPGTGWSWSYKEDSKGGYGPYGKFDIEVGTSSASRRRDPLSFSVTVPGHEFTISLIDFTTEMSDGTPGYLFAAHTAGFTVADMDRVTSAKFSTSPSSPVPEPATMFLLGSGLIGLAGFARRRFRK